MSFLSHRIYNGLETDNGGNIISAVNPTDYITYDMLLSEIGVFLDNKNIYSKINKDNNKKEKLEMPLNEIWSGARFWVKLHECNGVEFSPVVGNQETFDIFQKIYLDIERDASEKFGVYKCTQILASINRTLGVGKNINNFKLVFSQ